MPGNSKFDLFHEVKMLPKFDQFQRWSGYISMSNFRPFLLCILKKITEIPKSDLFHNIKTIPKWGKSTDHIQNLISSEGDQNTPACQISGHSSPVLKKMPGNRKFDLFYKVKMLPKWEKSTVDRQWPKSKISSEGGQDIYQHVKFQAIQSNCNKNLGEESILSLMLH